MPRPKTTRVLIETDGPEVVLEARAAGADDGSHHSAAPPGPSSQPSIADTSADTSPDAENAAEGGADADDVETAEAPLPLDDGKWDAVCSPPCQRRLPRAALFRITGAGITTSAAFSLPAKRPAVTLDVKTGTARWYWTGIVVSALGGSFLLGGAAPPLLMGGSFSTPQKILGGAGAVMLGVGLPLWIMNRTTVVIF